MTHSTNTERYAQLLHKFEPNSTLLHAWPLAGGVSASVMALEVMQAAGQIKKLIVRQHGARDLARNPQIAADEYALLNHLHAAGLATPIPYYLDLSCELFATPVIITEFVEGTVSFIPRPNSQQLHQFASQLASIHALDCQRLDVGFLPQQAHNVATQLYQGLHSPSERLSLPAQPGSTQRPDEPFPIQAAPAHQEIDLGISNRAESASDERRILDVLRLVWPIGQQNPSVLLHGDYWPGNTIWQDERLAAIIDWEDAAIGDPLADLANSRLEILWAGGFDAMVSYTQQYQAHRPIDRTNLPYWDLYAALRPARNLAGWGLDPQTEQAMLNGLRIFIEQAIAQIS